jgi:2-polyprenyl-3-methyl-5-hydroxy-6-metoxy-1,4-benzoquinol methylase
VNFTEQQKYLKSSRWWSDLAALLSLVASFLFWSILCVDARIPGIVFTLVVIAITGSLVYTPDYLHLNVNRTKRARWQIKIRWRLIAGGFVIGLLCRHDGRGAVTVVVACLCFAVVNFFAKAAVPPRYSSSYFWFTDCLLVGGLALIPQLHVMVVVALILVTAHLAIVTREENILVWTSVVTVSGSGLFLALLLRFSGDLEGPPWGDFAICVGLILVFTTATALLVSRSRRQNLRNIDEALSELKIFAGYSDNEIRELWATSNEQLAKNWKDAHLDESDREKMTAWYRENSELYMFAISGYNLEYKRIRDSIKMLKYGRGACLDYGAGNGEIILELARRGHAAIYFDVDGTSMRFARFRAERQKLAVEFFHSKDDLAASAKQHGLDTIFSFDVLEHLPDLPGELKFLSSLLNPGGRMAFDVPAGSTKAHPMHLNHHLEVNAYMKSIGMVEERGVMERIPFKKQEKFVFRRPA